jgi:hypothetical protein
MASRRPTSLPTGSPSSAPTSRPSVYDPYEPPAEVGNFLDPSSLQAHVIVITVSLILACIFVGYLGRHLARKYHPEWFRKGKKKKKKKKNDNNKSKEGEANSKKKPTKVAVKPLGGTEEVSPMAGKPKSLGSIVPMQDTAVALDGELVKVMEPGDLSDSEQKLEQFIESSSIDHGADTIDLAADPESGSGTATDDLGGGDIVSSGAEESTRLAEFPEQPGGADAATFLEDIAEEPEPEDGAGDIETGNVGYTGVPE